MSLIQINDLTFSYEGSYEPVFSNLSLQLDSTWRLGLVGRNGRGKTTLLRLLAGTLPAPVGSIAHSVPVSCFPLPLATGDMLTLEALETLDPTLEAWRLLRELNLLEVDSEVLYRPLSTLSGGERVKVQLAALFQQPDHFLLIDEPTDHMDLLGREVVCRYLKGKSGFLLVSHDRTFLDECVDHILAFNREDVQLIRGNFTTWWNEKERRDTWEQAENARLKQDIQRLEKSARRTAGWSDQVEGSKKGTRNSGLRPDRGFIGHKAAKMMKRSKTVAARQQQAITAKTELLRNIETNDSLALRPLSHPKERLVEALDFAPDYGSGPVCSPVSFTISQGERVALTGRNGTGKSSILKLLVGESIPHSGTLKTASGLVISYVPQDTTTLSDSVQDFAEAGGVDLTLFLTLLRKLDFARAQFEKDLTELSEGQKKKVLLARSICQPAHLYVWDEPLNYVDIFSRMQIETLFQQTNVTLLLVEHDRAFLDAVGARIINL